MDLIKEAIIRGYREGAVINYGYGENLILGDGEFEMDHLGRLLKYEFKKHIRDKFIDKQRYDVIYDEDGWANIVNEFVYE